MTLNVCDGKLNRKGPLCLCLVLFLEDFVHVKKGIKTSCVMMFDEL